MTAAVEELLAILNLERIEDNLFRGFTPNAGWQRVFGGQVIGQALVAACRTVKDRKPHSLHGYFLLGGDPSVPIIYDVERIRDGRSFTTRRVKAIQHGQPIFTLSASFQVEEEGFSHSAPMPDVPTPDDLPSEADIRQRVMPLMPDPVRKYFERERPIELRPVEYKRYMSREPMEPHFNVWMRATGPLPDDPAIHEAVLAYASDMTLLDSPLWRMAAPSSSARFKPQASIMRCGSTAPSGPMNGCSTRRKVPLPAARAASPAAVFSTKAGS
jgi:acyl-CoA thioesterase II